MQFSVLEADFQEEVNDANNMVVEEESDKEPMSFSTVNLVEDSQKSKGNLGHFPSFKFGVDKSKKVANNVSKLKSTLNKQPKKPHQVKKIVLKEVEVNSSSHVNPNIDLSPAAGKENTSVPIQATKSQALTKSPLQDARPTMLPKSNHLPMGSSPSEHGFSPDSTGKTLFVGQAMEYPYLVKANHLTHSLEVVFQSWLEPLPARPELVVMLSIPNEINRLMGLLSNTYTSTLPRIPISMEDRFPPKNGNLLPISGLIWNVQGAGCRAFMATLKDVIKRNNPQVLALVETHMGGNQAEKIAKILNYSGHTRVDANGFSGGIWVYWQKDVVTVEPIIKHEQYITMNITRFGALPWYFSAIYAGPDPTKRREFWSELRSFAENNNEPWLLKEVVPAVELCDTLNCLMNV